MTSMMKPNLTTITTDKYAYSLGLFMVVMLEEIEADGGLFRTDVMSLVGALKKKHLREERLGNQNYFKSVMIAGRAYRLAMDEMKDTCITVNATIGRIFFEHGALLKRVYGIDERAVHSMLRGGMQTEVMGSVRTSNCFMKHLNGCYGIESVKKIPKGKK